MWPSSMEPVNVITRGQRRRVKLLISRLFSCLDNLGVFSRRHGKLRCKKGGNHLGKCGIDRSKALGVTLTQIAK